MGNDRSGIASSADNVYYNAHNPENATAPGSAADEGASEALPANFWGLYLCDRRAACEGRGTLAAVRERFGACSYPCSLSNCIRGGIHCDGPCCVGDAYPDGVHPDSALPGDVPPVVSALPDAADGAGDRAVRPWASDRPVGSVVSRGVDGDDQGVGAAGAPSSRALGVAPRSVICGPGVIRALGARWLGEEVRFFVPVAPVRVPEADFGFLVCAPCLQAPQDTEFFWWFRAFGAYRDRCARCGEPL